MVHAPWLQACHTHPRDSGHQETLTSGCLPPGAKHKVLFMGRQAGHWLIQGQGKPGLDFLQGHNRLLSYLLPHAHPSSFPSRYSPGPPRLPHLPIKTPRIDRHMQPALDISTLPRSLLRTCYVLSRGNCSRADRATLLATDNVIHGCHRPASQWVHTVTRTSLLTWGLVQLHHGEQTG